MSFRARCCRVEFLIKDEFQIKGVFVDECQGVGVYRGPTFSVLNSNRKASFNTRPVSWEDCSVVAINSLKYDMESSSNPNVICISRCPSRSNNMGDSIISPACIEDWFSKISSESRLGFLEGTFPILSFNCFARWT